MICKNCNNNLKENSNFCSECGKEVFYENQSDQIVQEKMSFSPNPTKTHELVIKIVNCLLLIPYYISILGFGILIFTTLIVGLGAAAGIDVAPNAFFDMGAIQIITLFLITTVVILTFNITMGIIMHKKNKQFPYISSFKPIKKVTYVLLAYFFGIYGIHRFVIGDSKSGFIRLGITIGGTFIPSFISGLFNEAIVIGYGITFICIVISHGLSLSDFVIGLSKVSNENKMISVA